MATHYSNLDKKGLLPCLSCGVGLFHFGKHDSNNIDQKNKISGQNCYPEPIHYPLLIVRIHQPTVR